MATIRLMTQGDQEAVRQVEGAAFSEWWRRFHGSGSDRPLRTSVNVQACREKDPAGCFVAVEEKRVVGMIFSRTWGGVGWFGPFAVLPEHQGRGIGRELLSASLAYLRRDAKGVIGLETMPEWPYNVDFYLRQRFKTRLPTYHLRKLLDESSQFSANLQRWSKADLQMQKRWITNLREANSKICQSLDYTKEIIFTERLNLGETLIQTHGTKAVGQSTLLLESGRVGWGKDIAEIQVLALHPNHTDEQTFSGLLCATEALAISFGKKKLIVSANACHAWAIEILIERGYRIDRMMLRMVLEGTDEGPAIDNCVNLSRWAG